VCACDWFSACGSLRAQWAPDNRQAGTLRESTGLVRRVAGKLGWSMGLVLHRLVCDRLPQVQPDLKMNLMSILVTL